LRLAPWLREHRDRFFLATKTGERSYAGAREQIRRSLERMEVEQIDLIQLHCLVHPMSGTSRSAREEPSARPSRRATKDWCASSV